MHQRLGGGSSRLQVASWRLFAAQLVLLGQVAYGKTFTNAEADAAVKYWRTPGRYTTALPANYKSRGVYQVRLTPAASLWLWKYDRARGIEKGPPTQDAPALTPEEQAWNAWIVQKDNSDKFQAAARARMSNIEEFGALAPEVMGADEAPLPPLGLEEKFGPPPTFAQPAKITQYVIKFDDGLVLRYEDNTAVRTRSRYYRYSQGVMSVGTAIKSIPQLKLKETLRQGGVDDWQRKVFEAVSLLEGGFDSVNTYDTGFVSVGFIQFACLSAGAGSLGQVLLTQKRDNPESFRNDFIKYGINVTADGKLVALDLDSGTELVGADAAHQIILDKRLISVFQRAGQKPANQVAQVKIARSMYYPADESVVAAFNGNFLVAKVGSFIKSQAGMATLMDRKVNTGKLGMIQDVVVRIMLRENLSKIEDVAPWELEIVKAMEYRRNYLVNFPDLTKPLPLPVKEPANPPSR